MCYIFTDFLFFSLFFLRIFHLFVCFCTKNIYVKNNGKHLFLQYMQLTTMHPQTQWNSISWGQMSTESQNFALHSIQYRNTRWTAVNTHSVASPLESGHWLRDTELGHEVWTYLSLCFQKGGESRRSGPLSHEYTTRRVWDDPFYLRDVRSCDVRGLHFIPVCRMQHFWCNVTAHSGKENSEEQKGKLTVCWTECHVNIPCI